MNDSSRYPFRFPPPFANAWGDDAFGLWAEFTLTTTNESEPVIQRLRWIEPGLFWMGAPADEPERGDDEVPRHAVTLTRGLWLADTACTQALWEAVMGSNPSHYRNDPENPVENVSWNQVQNFFARLQERLGGIVPRLPSEAEWEYACRAGTDTAFFFGRNVTPEQVNYNGKHPYAGANKALYRKKTVPVKSLPPNSWGLYGMHGNVFEWCEDWFDKYSPEPETDPVGPPSGAKRVVRGGCATYSARAARSAYRACYEPDYHFSHIGFRLAMAQSEINNGGGHTRIVQNMPPPHPQFTLTDLGQLEGGPEASPNGPGTTTAAGLNNKGQVVGQSNGRAFLWSEGRMEDLSVFGIDDATAINDAGAIVGNQRSEDPQTMSRAVLWENGSMRLLETLGEGA